MSRLIRLGLIFGNLIPVDRPILVVRETQPMVF
jgi:hypothetical protein